MDRPINITYMIDVLDTDMAGTENQLIKLINGLDPQRFAVRLVCLSTHPWFEAHAGRLKCTSTVFAIKDFRHPRTYWEIVKLIRHLRAVRPDVVHTFFPVSNIVGVLAAKMAGVKTIISSRRDYGEWMTTGYLAATKFANRFAAAIVANSHAVKRLTEREETVRNGKLKVIFNGLDPEQFRELTPDPKLRKTWAIPEENNVVGLIANFRPMKHHHTFLKAAREILTVRTDVNFLLIGDGPLMHEIQQAAKESGVFEQCRFVGRQPNVTPFISIMDIGVNCSEMEGLSNAVMEYMASGISCVVADAGGNPDLITNDVNGYTFPLDDYKTLASMILRLLSNKATRERFIKNAREKIKNEMSLDIALAKYQTLYHELANA